MADNKREHRSGLRFSSRSIKGLLNFHKKTNSRIRDDSNIPQPPTKVVTVPAPEVPTIVSKVPKPPPAQPIIPAVQLEENNRHHRRRSSTGELKVVRFEEPPKLVQPGVEMPAIAEEQQVKSSNSESAAVISISVTAGAHIEADEQPVHAEQRPDASPCSDVPHEQSAPEPAQHVPVMPATGHAAQRRSTARGTVTSTARAAAARAARQAAATPQPKRAVRAPAPKTTTRSRVGVLEPVLERPTATAVRRATGEPLTPRREARLQARVATSIPRASAARLSSHSPAQSPSARSSMRSAAAASAASPKRRYGYDSGSGQPVDSPHAVAVARPVSRLGKAEGSSSSPGTPVGHPRTSLAPIITHSSPNTPRGTSAWRPGAQPQSARSASGTPRQGGTWGRPAPVQQLHGRSSSVAVGSRSRAAVYNHARFASSACVTSTVDPFLFTGANGAGGWNDGSPASSISDLPSYMAPTASSRRRVETTVKEKQVMEQTKLDGDDELENYVVEHRDAQRPERGTAPPLRALAATAGSSPAPLDHIPFTPSPTSPKDTSIWAAALETLSPRNSPRVTASPRVTLKLKTNEARDASKEADAVVAADILHVPGGRGLKQSALAIRAREEGETSHVSSSAASPRISTAGLTLSDSLKQATRAAATSLFEGDADSTYGMAVEGADDFDEAISPYLAPASRRAAFEMPELHSSGDISISAASTPQGSRYGAPGPLITRYHVVGEPYMAPKSPLGPRLNTTMSSMEAQAGSSAPDDVQSLESEGTRLQAAAPSVDSSLEEQVDTPRSVCGARVNNRRWPQLVLNQDILDAEPSSPVARVIPRFAVQ